MISRIVSYNDNIIRRPFVNVLIDGMSFSRFAEECSKKIGGKPEDWEKRNKSLLGLFDNKHKKLRIGTRFKIPHHLVEKAIDDYASSTSLSPDVSTNSTNTTNTSTSSPRISLTDFNGISYYSTKQDVNRLDFATELDNSLRKSTVYTRELSV
ncbi:hypothetical protein PBCVKS1B_554L [Paramecium bursaria Chlorella virus KS1B]|nr:hypothetical protein PBCVKS1B_554L [Paramecium bursaria Chlorella virus KS1B]